MQNMRSLAFPFLLIRDVVKLVVRGRDDEEGPFFSVVVRMYVNGEMEGGTAWRKEEDIGGFGKDLTMTFAS